MAAMRAKSGKETALNLVAFVVEDSPAIRDSLVEALAELAGITTAGTAGTEREAVAWLTDPANTWDIAIVDLGLGSGGGSGFGVLGALRQRRPTQKMVVLTGLTSTDVRAHCLALGADGVFDKSLETEALLDYCASLALPKQDKNPHGPK
jgi:two-component system OmpR family response regulator